MVKCAFCNLLFVKGCNVAFHRFPLDPVKRRSWLRNMKAHDWIPGPSARLCSNHFEDNCFFNRSTRTSLKRNMVPTIFEGEFNGTPSHKPTEHTSDVAFVEIEIKKELPTQLERESPEHDPFGFDSNVACIKTEIKTEESPLENEAHVPYSLLRKPLTKRKPDENKSEIGRDKSEKENEVISYSQAHKSTQCSMATSNYSITHDHLYEYTSSSVMKASQRIKDNLKISRARVHTLSQTVKRLKMKMVRLKSVIVNLKKENQLLKNAYACQIKL